MVSLFFNDGWDVTNFTEDADKCSIEAYYKFEPDHCIKCGVVGELYRHGSKKIEIIDLPLRMMPTVITLTQKRYQCRACNKTFIQPNPDIDPKRRITNRCVEYIEKQALRQTFTRIANSIGIDEKTVRLIVGDYLQRVNGSYQIVAPDILGIDEIHLIKQPRAVFTDIGRRKLIDMLPNRNVDLVKHWLSNLPHKDQVKYVAIDMWRGYKTAVNAILPNAQVVIDKFHVVRMANQAVDTVRKQQQNKLSKAGRIGYKRGSYILRKRNHNLSDKQWLALDGWLKNEPVIERAYNAKESYYAIFEHELRRDAEAAYEAWKSELTGVVAKAFAPLVKATDNWHDEIFALIDTNVTNAFTESMNNLTRLDNRIGRGYSFEMIRARMLFSRGVEYSYRCESCNGIFSKDEVLGSLDSKHPYCQSCEDRIKAVFRSAIKAFFYTGPQK